ncbi:MAG: hypothetical protein AAF518_07890 [Spirochaetota bacterium]
MYQIPMKINEDLLKFIDKMGQFYEDMGIPRIGGRMLGLMLIAEGPISTTDIEEILQVSRSSISTNIRMLIISGLAEQVSISGDRKDYFTFAENAWEKAILVRQNKLPPLEEITQEGIVSLQKHGQSSKKLEEMMDWIQLDKKYSELILEEWRTLQKKEKQRKKKHGSLS